jgi:hypothetical protein
MTGPTKESKDKVQKYIEAHFPDMAPVRPRVTTSNHGGKRTHRFTYRKALRSADEGTFQQVVHLTTDEDGKVLKVSVSR